MKFRKNDTNSRKVWLQHPDDLYYLNLIIENEDTVTAFTERRESKQADKIRSERGVKKKMNLTIKVEDKEYQNFDQRFRCHGKIIEGVQDVGNYHSLILKAGDDFVLGKKAWMPHHERMFVKAKKASFRAIAINVETDAIVFAELRTFGLRELKTINRAGGGKRKGGDTQKSFFERGVEQLKEIYSSGETLIILGPGFPKEDFIRVCKEKDSELFNRYQTDTVGQGGMNGINEALKSGKITNKMETIELEKELTIMEELKTSIYKDFATYGWNEVKDKIENGSVEKVIMLDTEIHQKKGIKMLALCERNRIEIVEISNHHEGGQMLEGLGKVACLLRYKAG